MIHAPLLSLLAHTVVHDEQARAIHAVQHRFGDGGAGLHHAHSFDLFEGGGKGTTEIFLHLRCRERLGGGIARVDDASGLHHGLVEPLVERAERHAQGAVAAHLVGGDVAVDIATALTVRLSPPRAFSWRRSKPASSERQMCPLWRTTAPEMGRPVSRSVMSRRGVPTG